MDIWADRTHIVMIGARLDQFRPYYEPDAHVYLLPPMRPLPPFASETPCDSPAVHLHSTPLPVHWFTTKVRTILMSKLGAPQLSTLDTSGDALMLYAQNCELSVYCPSAITLTSNTRTTTTDFANYVLLARSDTFNPDHVFAGQTAPTAISVVGEYAIELYSGATRPLRTRITRLHAAAPTVETAESPQMTRVTPLGSSAHMEGKEVEPWRGCIFYQTWTEFGLQDLHICYFVDPNV